MYNKYDKYSSGRVSYNQFGAVAHNTSKQSKTKVINIYLIDVILVIVLIVGLLVLVSKI